MLGIIVQARSGSTRLPHKMTLPFYKGSSILEILLEKLKDSFPNIPIVLATTLNVKDDIIVRTGKQRNILVYRGSENDVLDRFIQSAQNHKISKIVRVCADNPFLDMEALKKLIIVFNSNPSDYISFKTSSNLPTIRTHFGFWAEGVKLEALEEIYSRTQDMLYLEHVTNYIYDHKLFFKMFLMLIPAEVEEADIRLTIDTLSDFEVSMEIYAQVQKRKITGVDEIVKFISKNKEWMKIMKEQIQLNTK